MKEIILSIALLLSLNLETEGQSNGAQSAQLPRPLKFEHEDECGSPVVESMLWLSVEGKAINVIDGDTIIVLTKDHKRKRVNLVAVRLSTEKDRARRLLSALVLNRRVSVLVNPTNIKANTVFGVVHTVDKDINRELLEAGAVRYHKPEPYAVSHYTACVYRIVERKAREAKKGLWQSPSG